MKRTLFVWVFLCMLVTARGSAQENKPRIKVGGTIFLHGYYDSYQSVDNRSGISYSFPLAPNPDPDGRDKNRNNQFALAANQTRVSVTVQDFRVLNAAGHIYAEGDFSGSSSDFVNTFRIRHAYLHLQWEKDELLLGQANNLESVDDVSAGVLTTGSGSPIAIQSRLPQIRYGRKLGGLWKGYAAVSFPSVSVGDSEVPGTFDALRNSGLPSVEVRLEYGSPERFLIGITGGYKKYRPRLETNTGHKATSTIGSGNGTLFVRGGFHGHTIKFQTLYGSNLTHLDLVGGYGKKLSDGEEGDYGYTNFKGVSAWVDYESKGWKNFHAGIFVGYMENLGTGKAVDPSVVYARYPGLHHTERISPRITYVYRNLLLGIEYSLYSARWGKTFDPYYLPLESHPTTRNNRVMLLARYVF